MKLSVACTAFLASVSLASPVSVSDNLHTALQKRADRDESFAKQYVTMMARTHYMYYYEGFKKLNLSDWRAAGFTGLKWDNLRRIRFDTGAMMGVVSPYNGYKAYNFSCVFDFGTKSNSYTVADFLKGAGLMEHLTVAAYYGAMDYIDDKNYLERLTGQIALNARHDAFFSSLENKLMFPQPLYSRLDMDSAYSVISKYIVSCPADNPFSQLKAFPTMTGPLEKAPYYRNTEYTWQLPKNFTFPAGKQLYIAWPSYTNLYRTEATIDKKAKTVKAKTPYFNLGGPVGRSYGMLTAVKPSRDTSDPLAGEMQLIKDEEVLAGPLNFYLNGQITIYDDGKNGEY